MTKKQLQSSFTGPLEPSDVSPIYKLSLTLIAMAMLLLPLIYLAIVAFSIWGVYFFVQDPFSVFAMEGGGIWKLIFYITPVIANATIAVFMFKPLFTPVTQPAMGVEIGKKEEPVLFDFIEMICAKVNAPIPKRVLLNSEPNAAAKFGNGISGFLKGDLELVIGLPLVSSLSVTQLGGILAHEFGHFAQGAGMRVSYLVRTINGWFFRLVFERDSWDERIHKWSTTGHIATLFIFGIARIGIWISRLILHGLLITGNFISALMLRQMEYDADQYEIKFGGSENFESTTKKLALISINSSIAQQNIFENWANKKLNNNISSFIASRVEKSDPVWIKQIDESIEASKTGFFDTHPSDKDRIKQARELNAEGIFHLDKNATSLFQNFENCSIEATKHFYKLMMNQDFKEEYLVDFEAFEAENKFNEENSKALGEFFSEAITMHYPIIFKKGEYAPFAESAFEELMTIKQQLSDNKEAIAKLITKKFELQDKLMNWEGAKTIVKSGGKVQPKPFGLKKGKLPEINALIDESVSIENELDIEYSSMTSHLRVLPQVLKKAYESDNTIISRIDDLVNAVQAFNDHYESFRLVRKVYDSFFILAINMEQVGSDKKVVEAYSTVIKGLKEELRKSYAYFKEVQNPLDLSQNLGDKFFPDGVEKMLQESLQDIYLTYSHLYQLNYARLLGELGVLALQKIEA